jgi:hypothetical protein
MSGESLRSSQPNFYGQGFPKYEIPNFDPDAHSAEVPDFSTLSAETPPDFSILEVKNYGVEDGSQPEKAKNPGFNPGIAVAEGLEETTREVLLGQPE